MAHQTRMPSVKLTLDKGLFNQLISVLDYNIKLKVDSENFSVIASKLKEKLLHYSVPRINDKDEEFVDVRFFPNEASDMIWQLLLRADKNEAVEDFFTILISTRENK